MCGIAGCVRYGDGAPPVDVEELRRAAARMASRGPDGEGVWISPDARVGLGHRRLAIIDLSERAAQPMIDPETGNVIVFNGEIYNYREMRKDLEGTGAAFRSNSDTEVLLHLYARHGEAMLPRLRGMYAFAVWDEGRRRIFLARDPFGIKPLYLADDGTTLRFASQVKALLAAGGVDTSPDPAGHVGFFLWGHVPDPFTLYKGIRALPAGTWLSVALDGRRESGRHQTRRRPLCCHPAAGKKAPAHHRRLYFPGALASRRQALGARILLVLASRESLRQNHGHSGIQRKICRVILVAVPERSR